MIAWSQTIERFEDTDQELALLFCGKPVCVVHDRSDELLKRRAAAVLVVYKLQLHSRVRVMSSPCTPNQHLLFCPNSFGRCNLTREAGLDRPVGT